MFKQHYNVLGAMSGTSLDGLDLAHIYFYFEKNKWHFKILESTTIGYSDDWILRLKTAVDFSAAALLQLDKDYTILLSNMISDFISNHNLNNLDAVCSHGHTILHQPQNCLFNLVDKVRPWFLLVIKFYFLIMIIV